MGTIDNRIRLTDANGNPRIVPALTTLLLTGVLLDETGVPIALASLSTLTLTIYAPEMTGQPIINSVSAVNVKNDGTRGVVHATNGTMTLTLLPADGTFIGTGELELHRALLEWTYGSGGSKAGWFEIDYHVRAQAF